MLDCPDRYVCLAPLNDRYQLVLLVKEPSVADKNRDDDTEGYKNNRTQKEFQFSRVFSIFGCMVVIFLMVNVTLIILEIGNLLILVQIQDIWN